MRCHPRAAGGAVDALDLPERGDRRTRGLDEEAGLAA
jgi:hypothetical protein